MLTERRTLRIVMVDDDPEFLAMARAWLEPRYEVVPLTEGGDLAATIAALEPDLVLLDVRMAPDGFALCRRLHAEPELESVPIVFLTASHGDADFLRNLEAGGAGYLNKPLSRKELLARVGEFLKEA